MKTRRCKFADNGGAQGAPDAERRPSVHLFIGLSLLRGANGLAKSQGSGAPRDARGGGKPAPHPGSNREQYILHMILSGLLWRKLLSRGYCRQYCRLTSLTSDTQLDLIVSNQWQYGALMAASRAPSRMMRAYRSEGSVREVVRAHGLVLNASARCTRGPSAS